MSFDDDQSCAASVIPAAKRTTAAPWIKWTVGLSSKTEVLQMARWLNRSRRELACMCMEVWEWADRNAGEDGNAPGVTREFLDERVGLPGFAAAMERAGWLLVDGDGVIFPNYDRHNGNNAKKRAQTQKRVANHRSR